MRIYLFSISGEWGNPKLTLETYFVEEKTKSYMGEGRRFNKSDIGVATGYSGNECLLLENSPSKAAKILIESMEKQRDKLIEKVGYKEGQIAKLKEYINEQE